MRDIKQHVDTNFADFKQGVEAGLNSAAGTKNWQAELVSENLFKEPSTPLFLSNSSDGKKGNAQDEKDESEE